MCIVIEHVYTYRTPQSWHIIFHHPRNFPHALSQSPQSTLLFPPPFFENELIKYVLFCACFSVNINEKIHPYCCMWQKFILFCYWIFQSLFRCKYTRVWLRILLSLVFELLPILGYNEQSYYKYSYLNAFVDRCFLFSWVIP